MVDDTLEDTGSRPDSGRIKRAPPTIDLKATEVSSETKEAPEPRSQSKAESAPESRPGPEAQSSAPAEAVKPEQPSPGQLEPEQPKLEQPESEQPKSEQPKAATARAISPRSVSPWVIAPFSGAVAAALVIGVGWMLGWPQVAPPPTAPSPSAAAVDNLTTRVAGLEAKSSKPVAPDAALVARLEALEKSEAAARSDLASLHTQADKVASALNEAKPTPRENGTGVDVAALNERIDQIERASRAQGAEAAQPKPADDLPLRRLVAAALLDVAVRHGDPYPAALAAAKSLAPNPDALKPLDEFAASGVPNPFALSRDLLTLVPKLSPPPPADNTNTTGSGIVDRLQAGASKLVRIERTDAVGNDRGAVVARVTAAALHNDFAEARRELNSLAPADRAAAQGWLDKVAARDAALAASRQFAGDSMAALAKPAQ
jgi:hypothetical protein